jgi:diguanylate cyclase (GGDEF)-like protein
VSTRETPRARTIRLPRELTGLRGERMAKRASIQVLDGSPSDLGIHEPLDTPLVVGRGEEAGFQITDDSASRAHALVGWEESEAAYVVRDLGSTNGTFVNGVATTIPTALRHGDRIEIGETVLEFRIADDQEIENRERMEAWLSTDELTGLPNKRRFDGSLRRRVKNLEPQQGWMAILMLDLDNLKVLNDQHGHHLGSRVIREVGRIIGRVTAGKGQATRFGGDEYTVYLVQHDLAAALLVAEEIRAEVAAIGFEVEAAAVAHTTISIGVSAGRCTGLDPETLCREADKALYRAKAAGRNCVRV